VNRFRCIFRRDASRNQLLIPFANRQTEQTLKTTLLAVIRAMAPTFVAPSFASVAHAQGTMDFSGATTLTAISKTFAICAGAAIWFGGLNFARIRIMSGRFQDAIPATERTALRVDQYAAFIHASAADVDEHALADVFSKGRDFQEYLKSFEAQRITPTQRIRRAPASDDAEAPSKPALQAAVALGAKA
jgi:hypothetical protein